jgi:hypothetical protein
VPLSRTFTINPKGQIQKASTAVQSSTWSSLSAINELVHEMFPALAAALRAVRHSSHRALTHTHSSTFFDTMELAASMGVVQQEAAAAVLEQLRRGSSSGAGGPAGFASAESSEGSTAAAEEAAAGGTPTAGAAAMAAEAAAAQDLVPARDEYNDMSWWRPSLAVNIEDKEELALLRTTSASSKPQPQQAAS